jgi:hypothetical protein
MQCKPVSDGALTLVIIGCRKEGGQELGDIKTNAIKRIFLG